MRDEESGVVRALRDGNWVATESGLLSLHPSIAEIKPGGQVARGSVSEAGNRVAKGRAGQDRERG